MKLLLYIGSLFFLQILYSQEVKLPFHYLEHNLETKIDTSDLFNFHEYRNDSRYLSLGSNGLANYSLVFDADKSIGYAASHLLRDVKDFSYKEYAVFDPFTSVKFIQGARLEQFFKLVHTQNFSENGNFSLSYKKINSDGSYLRQKANNNDLNASIWYAKNRYKIGFFANRIKNTTQQNGGLVEDTTFTVASDFGSNRKTIPIYLDSAVDLKIANQLALFQAVELTKKTDSLGYGTSSKLLLKSKFTNSKRFYTDNQINTSFYQHLFIDSSKTNDSIKLNQLEQEIAYQFTIKQNKYNVNLSPSVNYYYTDYRQATTHRYMNDFSVGFKGEYQQAKLNFTADLNYFVEGYRKSNYDFNTTLKVDFTKGLEWYIDATLKEYSPSLDLEAYYGNHAQWNASFVPTNAYLFSTGTQKNKWDVIAKVTYMDIKNPIFFKYDLTANQVQDYTQIIQAEVAKEFKVKNWSITPQVVHQYTGGALVYRLPTNFASLKLGYNFKAFKKSLAVFTGVKLTYYSEVQLMSYSPSLGQFYLTNNTSTGNYPFVDFFINTQIKSVRLFFALTHLNSGLINPTNYFGAQHYPLEDRAFKLGINWIFLK